MGERLEALRALLGKVEQDAAHFTDFTSAFVGLEARLAYKADAGSLDAVDALHSATLPAWGWVKSATGSIGVFQVRGGANYYGPPDDPARSWLIAILKALIAKEEA